MRDVLAIAKALADPNRIRILCALRRGELCVCHVIALLRLAPSTVSKHLSILYQARLIEGRKDGKWMHYRLPSKSEAVPAARDAVAWIHRHLDGDPAIADDARRLESLLSMPPEAVCQSIRKDSRCCSSARGTRAGAKWPRAGRGR